MNNELSVIILSAGIGTRMKSKISKPLHKIGNLEMINHVINSALKLESSQIIIVASDENKDDIQRSINNNIDIVIQKDRNGTAGATKVALKLLNDTQKTLIMYGDVPLIKQETYNFMINNNSDLAVLAFNTKDITNKYGRLIVKDNKLEKIVEFKDASEEERKNTLCNSGVIVIKTELLKKYLDKIDNNNASKEYYLTDIIEICKKNNNSVSFTIGDEDEVVGVNSRDQLAMAENIFQRNKRIEFMKNGVTLIDPNTVYFSYDTEIENDVIVEPNVFFMPGVKIHSNVTIKAFSYLEDCEIKSNVVIGPFARIRPETTIENDAKIGNFCEIKKSKIGKGTKVNHLTYIGDSIIGDNTNIGAGTITCNYDGYSKFKTNIGSNCFIGSNTTIISPVNIENNCLTAAGSVITKDISENSIAISRTEQQNLKDAMTRYRKKREKF